MGRRKHEIDPTAPQAKTVAQMCHTHQICKASLYKEIRAGRLRFIKIGQTTRFTPEQEREWIARLEAESNAPAA